MRASVRIGAAATIVVLASAGPLAAVPSVPSQSAAVAGVDGGACRDDTGVTVVVDARAFGDGVQVRCAPQPVRSGFEALTKAGFTYQGTVRFPGLLCRIDGEPASDPCQSAPPPGAYWGYWHAPRGGSWTYSTSGAGGRVPPPGSVEGWAFGARAAPGVAPPAPPPAPTTTRPAATPTSRPASGAADGALPAPVTPPARRGGDGSSSTTAAPDPTAPPTTASDEGEAGSDDDGPGPPSGGGASGGDEAAAAPARDGGGSPAGAVAGLAAVAGLGLASLVVVRRRRATADPVPG